MTSRRSFLASVAAAIAGRALVRKPVPPSTVVHFVGRDFHHSYQWVPGDGSLFNPRENLAALYIEHRCSTFGRDAFTLADSEFDRRFAFASLYPPALVLKG